MSDLFFVGRGSFLKIITQSIFLTTLDFITGGFSSFFSQPIFVLELYRGAMFEE